MDLSVSVTSHRGKVRQKNEDNLYVNGLTLPQQNSGLRPQSITLDTAQPRLLGVFDGMGGYAAGERASYLAVEAVNEFAGPQLHNLPANILMMELCRLANERVCDEMLRGDNSRIGTTASMLHFYQDCYTVCNVGDSPIYLFRSGVLRCIHQEHSEKANYERITGKPAPPNKKFRLTQNIGIFADEMLIEPYCHTDILQDGDCFLICSDGLSDMVSMEHIAGVLASSLSQQQKVETLLQAALDNGGKDNITIILVTVKASSQAGIFCCSRKNLSLAIIAAAIVLFAAIVAVIFFASRSSCNHIFTSDPTGTTASIAATNPAESTTPTETAVSDKTADDIGKADPTENIDPTKETATGEGGSSVEEITP